MARKTQPPVIERIPAEIHLRAQEFGLIAETYAEVIAGHGVTGRVSWALSRPTTDASGQWTDAVRLRYGTVKDHEWARAELRHALDEVAALHAAAATEIRGD